MYPCPCLSSRFVLLTTFSGAANRQPDSCTNDPDGARRLNVEATRTLANLTTSRSILLIYISTDYVFPGRRGEAPYAATAEPSPPNIYGQTKLDGEAAVLKVTKKMGTQHLGVILRVPVLYGKVEPEGNNKESAINVLMDGLWKSQDKVDAEAAQKIKMDHYAQRFPTNTEDVGKVLVQIAQKYTSSKAKEQGLPQILQFSSEDQMTKFEICEVFAEIMGLSMDGIVKDIPKDDPSAGGTVRPYDCHLSTKELKDIGMDVSTMDFKAWWRREVGAFRH